MMGMVKRVARAIMEARGGCRVTDWREANWNPAVAQAISDARAAIAAMREPTDEIAEAVWAETGDPCWKENAIEAWRAGIDAALATSKDTP